MKFILDFFNTIIGFSVLALISTFYIVGELFEMLKKILVFTKYSFVEFMVDISFILYFFLNISLSYFSFTSKFLSRLLDKLAEISSKKSENITNKLWLN